MVVQEVGYLTSLLLGIARALILVAGGAVGIYKVVKGRSDENPKEFHEGLIIVGAAGVLFAATYGVEVIFSGVTV